MRRELLFFSFKRTGPTASTKPPCPNYRSTVVNIVVKTSQQSEAREVAFFHNAKTPLHCGMRSILYELVCLFVCVCPFVFPSVCRRPHHPLRELHLTGFLKPDVYGSKQACANVWDTLCCCCGFGDLGVVCFGCRGVLQFVFVKGFHGAASNLCAVSLLAEPHCAVRCGLCFERDVRCGAVQMFGFRFSHRAVQCSAV